MVLGTPAQAPEERFWRGVLAMREGRRARRERRAGVLGYILVGVVGWLVGVDYWWFGGLSVVSEEWALFVEGR